jgi:hypothetical protein
VLERQPSGRRKEEEDESWRSRKKKPTKSRPSTPFEGDKDNGLSGTELRKERGRFDVTIVTGKGTLRKTADPRGKTISKEKGSQASRKTVHTKMIL